jgi:hypothetical protein
MRDIYSQMKHFVAWLGEEIDDSSLAMDAVRTTGAKLAQAQVASLTETSLPRQKGLRT